MNIIRAHYKDQACFYKIGNFICNYVDVNTVIVCIGTDRCIGDSLGPLVGTFLTEKNFPLPIYGTISDPIHALNIDRKLTEIKYAHPNAKIIAIDACLGHENNIGEIHARDCPIQPGKGVGKKLPPVGESSIIAIVDSSENNIFSNTRIRLDFIFKLANAITQALFLGYESKKAKS
ncbi:spore protease YyaC [Clostridium malenominatum]|uniref:Spore protease YyaC n=1 Tax=Clostridium malenominatum TaxID=1539 RepID=A0ABN1J4R6_9CLOT